MGRSWLVFFLCVVTFAGALSTPADSRQSQASSSTSSASSTASAAKPAATTTAKKTTATTHKKHHTTTKFVPKQKVPTPDRISEIQSALAHGGYYQGDPNGKWDGNTIAAMQKFQSANGLDATGKLDAPSLQKLGLGSDIAGVSAPKPVTPSTTTPVTVAPASAAPSNSGAAVAAPATISPAAGAVANNSAKQ
jgi:peptidoglycan hydrolase-like protein with peptidoglycan-binding domain